MVRLWDANTGEETAVLAGHAGRVNAVAYSPLDGIASAGEDGTVRIWDAHTGAELDVLTGHGDGVNAVAYSPDGRRIASSGHDGTVRIWDPQKAAQTRVTTADSEAVLSVAYSPDGSKIAWSGSDGVRIWDVRSGGRPQETLGRRQGVTRGERARQEYARTHTPPWNCRGVDHESDAVRPTAGSDALQPGDPLLLAANRRGGGERQLEVH